MFELKTVTYGTVSTPFLVTRCLKQLGLVAKSTYPNASRAIIKDFYVDDLLTGVNSVEEIIILYNQINEIMYRGKIELRK